MQFNWCTSPVIIILLLQRYVTLLGPASDGNPLVNINLHPIVYCPHLSRSISGTRKVKINDALFSSWYCVTIQGLSKGNSIHIYSLLITQMVLQIPSGPSELPNMISRLPNSGDATKKITGDWLKHPICWYFRVLDKRWMKVLCKDQFLKGGHRFLTILFVHLTVFSKCISKFSISSTWNQPLICSNNFRSGVLVAIEIVNKLFLTLDFSLGYLVSPVGLDGLRQGPMQLTRIIVSSNLLCKVELKCTHHEDVP